MGYKVEKLTGTSYAILTDDGEILGIFTDNTGNKKLANLLSASKDMQEALEDIVEQAEKTKLPLGADLADSIRVFGKQALAKSKGK